MGISPFVLNKTRLIVISNQVVQITLSSKSSFSESLYNSNQSIQDEIKKVVIAFVKLKEDNLIVDGNGYSLLCKKHSWQYGRKYVFFKNKTRLKVHRYKYTFELEPVTTSREESASSHVGKKNIQQQQKDDHDLPQITEIFSDSDAANTSFLSEGDVVGVEATPNRSRTLQLAAHEVSEITKNTAASSIQLAMNKDLVDQSARKAHAHTEDRTVQSESTIAIESTNRISSSVGITVATTAEISSPSSSDSSYFIASERPVLQHSSGTDVIDTREVSNEFNGDDDAEGSTNSRVIHARESILGKRKERSDDYDYSLLNPLGFIKRMFGGNRRTY